MIYSEQLATTEWKERRQQIFERDNFKCVKCGSGDNLRCHHLLYCNGFKAWEYADHCLQTLCKDCHKEAHTKTAIEIKYGGIKKNKEHYTKSAYKEKVKKKSDQKKKINRINRVMKQYSYSVNMWINQREFLLSQPVPNQKNIQKNLINLDKEIQKFAKFKKAENVTITPTFNGSTIQLHGYKEQL